jgi:leader peptidase (prepilin peptidase)/N-methyltransferase
VTAILAGGVGLLIGSFLNVVAHRVPLRLSIVSPPSACPQCSARIRGYDNIPVVSWLLLGGKCRDCRRPISARYPLVEASTAALFWLVVVWFSATRIPSGFSRPSEVIATTLAIVAFLYFGSISVVLTLIDIDTHTLPNRIVLPSLAVGTVLLGAAAVVGSDPSALLRAVIGSASLFLFYLVLALAYPRGMGFGDVKLAAVIGLYLGYLGWGELVVGAFGAFFVGGLFGLLLMVFRRATRKTSIPFGPWMLGGAWIGAIFGNSIARGYLSAVGLA